MNTPTVELVTIDRFPEYPPITSAAFRDLVEIWRRNRRPEDMVDIMDAGIASGSRLLAVEGARKLVALGANIRDGPRLRAEAILFGRQSYVARSDLPLDERVRGDVYDKIARLKIALQDSPRNALIHVEMSRLYCRLAQFDQARHHMSIATNISPDDRFVLRAATRFYTMLALELDALRLLRKSDRIKFDPWVQSAELAAAELAGRKTRFADRAAKQIVGQRHAGRAMSELAAGWVSKLWREGIKTKQMLRLLSKALWDPTENALAQGVWLIDTAEGNFASRFPQIRPSEDAHEAKSLLLTEQGDFVAARVEAENWFLDQPFQARAAIHLGHLDFVHLREYDSAAKVVESGLKIHEDDWILLNLGVLSNIYAKNFERANQLLHAFEKTAESGEQRAYLDAARGMYAIETGKLDEGLAYYQSAIKISKRYNKPELVVNAAIYMMELASRHGLLDPGVYNQIRELVPRAINKLSASDRGDMERTWGSRQIVIEEHLDQFRLDLPPDRAISRELIEGSLDVD